MFLALILETQSKEQTVCREASESDSLFFRMSENEATQPQSLSFCCFFFKKSAFSCFMEHAELSTAAWLTRCHGVGSWSHWALWIPSVCLSGRTPCTKCVCAVPLRKCSIAFCVSHFKPMEKKLSGCLLFHCGVQMVWFKVLSKAHRERSYAFCLFF